VYVFWDTVYITAHISVIKK